MAGEHCNHTDRMPSLPTHLVVAAALGQCAGPSARRDWRFWLIVGGCSALPDADILGFRYGIHYGDLWGHRGLTHSILFAAVAGIVGAIMLGGSRREKLGKSLLLFGITCSHGVLDAMTNGGLGVAFFSPVNVHRYFLPWRPIEVSPLRAGGFVSWRGVDILLNEIAVVWLPALLLGAVLYGMRRWSDSVSRTSASE